jgi:nicotinamidase-related amidase
MPVDRWANPALLIVDMQNDFVRKGAPMEVPDARATIPQHQELLAASVLPRNRHSDRLHQVRRRAEADIDLGVVATA